MLELNPKTMSITSLSFNDDAPDASEIDWVELFPTAPQEIDGELIHPIMTPRTAALLHTLAYLTVDSYIHDLEPVPGQPGLYTGGGPDALIESAVPTRAQTLGWHIDYLTCFLALAQSLEAGHEPLPNSTGQEAALHTLLMAMDQMTEDEDLIDPEFYPTTAALPVSQGDFDFYTLWNDLFEDHHVLAFNQPELDGFENDEALHQHLGLANIEHAEWFLPFR